MRRFYGINTVWICTFLGGPLVAGYMMSENFRTFHKVKEANKTWVISIIFTLLLLLFVLFFENVDLFVRIAHFTYTGVVYWLATKYQKEDIQQFLEEGGEEYSIWRKIAVVLIGAFALGVVAFMFFAASFILIRFLS
ncbi:MAG: hypothetical protein NZM38_09585 [Cytophagales bacterium]|nr:hypothetical protein [Cytophagales bacterium]MDW8385008.1 hypothetical protein [Flammeovirgaceae bacterium]